MYLIHAATYLPAQSLDNAYFSARTGKEPEWFLRRTGIETRRRAGGDDNTHVMAVKAVEALKAELGGKLPASIDLIVSCTYTPWDTLVTMAHAVQQAFGIARARAIHVASACSSFLSALELVGAMFESGRSRLALVVLAEHNSLYARDDDIMSGHLWGDGAAAVLLSAAALDAARYRVTDIVTAGLAHVGKGLEAIQLVPSQEGLVMAHGREIFEHACEQMVASVREILERNGLGIDAIRLLVPHQANRRILTAVARTLELDPSRVAVTVDKLGNTGCASTLISLALCDQAVVRGEWVVLAAFGGGYSSGAALLKRL